MILTINNNNNLKGLIYDILYIYNYKIIHSSTDNKSIDLKNITDNEIINIEKQNIVNKYKQFYIDDNNLYNKCDKYLLVDNGIIKY